MDSNNEDYFVSSRQLLFKNKHMKDFSFASHDKSPLHMDDDYAKKTIYEKRILFGFLGGLSSLGKVIKNNNFLSNIKIEFRNPMYHEIEYNLSLAENTYKDLVLNVYKDNTELMHIKGSLYNNNNSQLKAINEDSNKTNYMNSIQKEPLDYNEKELLQGITKSGYYKTNIKYVNKLRKELFPSESIVKPVHIDSLMLCSYIAGMILPGRRSLCKELNMNFYDTNYSNHNELDYNVKTIFYDKNFGLLGINIKIYHLGNLLADGELQVCIREEEWISKPVNHNQDTIAIASTFTDQPILASMDFWKQELKMQLDVKLTLYNQVFQELLNPNSMLSKNRRGMNVILFRFEDWLRFKENTNIEVHKLIENPNFLHTTLDNFISAIQF
jgi:hypothetical protein